MLRPVSLFLPWAALAVGLVACGPPRSIDGHGNNPFFPDQGAAGTQLLRLIEPDYADGVSALAGPGRPSARVVSNEVCDQAASIPNAANASDFVWQWGQFVDHDIDLTPGASPAEPAPIPVPTGDPFFDPFFTGTQVIPFNRSIYDTATGTDPSNPRQQLNLITSFIDASNVYGSDPVRADALRANDGTGRLRTSAGDLLPFNTFGLPNANDTGLPEEDLFLAGDVRANEQVGLTAMHTLFVREHNRLADRLREVIPPHWGWDGDDIYELARRIVGAEIQVITYKEFLPVLLGPNALPPSTDHGRGHGRSGRFRVDPSITNVFSTGPYRFGHSMLSSSLQRLDSNLDPSPGGPLPLRNAFFNPPVVVADGIEPYLRGLAWQVAQEIDVFVVDDVRNFLFGPPGAGGFDLASLNIQRGRDHGLPSYNGMRMALGQPPAADYDEISSSPQIAARLEAAYGPGNVDDVDLWVGCLAEDHVPGALVGPLVHTMLSYQFQALRDGDRFWYERKFEGAARVWVEQTTLARVIRRNTNIGNEIPENAFLVP